jgi:hypothetical protein
VHLDQLFAELAPAFKSEEDYARARMYWLAGLLNLGRHTVTGALTTAGQQQRDWSAAYRSLQRLPVDAVFAHVQRHTLAQTEGPWVVALDDTATRKTGRRIPGCGWRRDPLSPKFHTNLHWGQRILQFSAAIPAADGSARLVPISWQEAPVPRRPRQPDAAPANRPSSTRSRCAASSSCAPAPIGRFTSSAMATIPTARSCGTCRRTRY